MLTKHEGLSLDSQYPCAKQDMAALDSTALSGDCRRILRIPWPANLYYRFSKKHCLKNKVQSDGVRLSQVLI